ncbi:MAG: ATP-binding cassette domain-containing protein [Candidatus Parabeggiatoa sp.]|nr:ATP-binding cassette domain-containing protein [Candidatus Parabeggiatoa sp.]
MSKNPEFTIGNSPENTYYLSESSANKIHLAVTPVSAVEYLIHNRSDNLDNLTVDHRQRGVVMARVDKFTPLQLGKESFTLGELLKNKTFLAETKSVLAQSQTEYRLETGKAYLAGASDICDIVLPSPRVAWHALELKSHINQWEIRFVADNKTMTLQNGSVVRVGPYSLELKETGHLISRIASHDRLTLRNIYVINPKDKQKFLIHDCSLSIQAGEFMGIIGPSGAGKSTLLKAIRAIIPIKSGQITLSGQNTRKNDDILKEIGFVPQDDVVIPELTVAENLRFAATLRLPSDWVPDAIEQKVEELLKAMNLEGQRNSYCSEISGGQRKRVNLALELMLEPTFLLADEVCSGLSSLDTDNILQHLREIADNGKGVMLTIHSPDIEAFDLMDTLLVLDIGGFVAYYGPAQEAIQYFARREHSPYKSPKLIFDVLEKKSVNEERQTEPEEWHQIYKMSPYHQEYIEAKLSEE